MHGLGAWVHGLVYGVVNGVVSGIWGGDFVCLCLGVPEPVTSLLFVFSSEQNTSE